MAMIKCPECGKNLSDKAAACPNCGCPIEDIKERIHEIEIEKDKKDKEKAEEKKAKEMAIEIKRQQRVEAKKSVTLEMKKKRIFIALPVIVMIVVAGFFGWYYGIKIPQEQAYSDYIARVDAVNKAIKEYNTSVDEYNTKAKEIIVLNNDFDGVINEAQSLIDSGDTPYEGEKITVLSNTLKEARNNKIKTPELKEVENEIVLDSSIGASNISKIKSAVVELNTKASDITSRIDEVGKATQDLVVPDYEYYMSTIGTQSKELQDSYQIQKQITAPSEEWVIQRLGRVDNVANIAPVTEENDPNGHLNKDGGYTATVYFSSPLLKKANLSGNALIDEGTVAGGAIEVYRTEEDAESRRKYLATFDGGIFASGSHVVLGTMLIRTSDDLKASEQETLTNAIVAAMTAVE